MERQELVKEIGGYVKSLAPLFRYLIFQTETHAFCLALACAALIGFYPFCVLLLSLMKLVFHWNGGYQTLLGALRVFYPTDPAFLVKNLEVTVSRFGNRFDAGSVFWVFLGAAGVFIPLEAGLNRLWKVEHDRSYWMNQAVGFGLTAVSCVLALVFVAINNAIQTFVRIPVEALQTIANRVTLHITAACFFSIAIFLFYKFLPNKKVDTFQVLPAAILTGFAAEIIKDIYVLVLPFMDIGSNSGSQGPFYVSVSFVILGYIETFVVLGGAFLASQTETYPWMGFVWSKKTDA